MNADDLSVWYTLQCIRFNIWDELHILIGLIKYLIKRNEIMSTIVPFSMKKSIEILCNLLNEKLIPSKCQNERYLHHYYSKNIQEFFNIDFRNLRESQLHPEYPTYKNSTRIFYSKYRKNDENKYIIAKNDDKGSSGFIDFAIGDYKEPEFAIEFTSKYGFSSEDLTFDFLKLLDSNNRPFKGVISFNLIYREKELSKYGRKDNIEKALENIRAEILDKSRGRNLDIAENRIYLFWIIEIDENGKKRSWFCTDINKKFFLVDANEKYSFEQISNFLN